MNRRDGAEELNQGITLRDPQGLCVRGCGMLSVFFSAIIRRGAVLGLIGLLVGCDDAQQRGLNELAARGYSLSVAEFHRAAEAGDVEALEAFLRSGTGVDVSGPKGETALMKAIAAGRAEAADFLLKQGAKPVHTLAMAAAGGDAALVKQVLAAHSAPEIRAALVQAAGRGQAEVLRVLLPAAGADLPAEALSGAAEHGEVECVDALLQAGAEVDALEAARGLTALHLAVKGGHADAVSLLLSNGADRFALDREGRSVWEIAPEPAAKLVPVEDVEAAPPKRSRLAGAVVQGGLTLLDTHAAELPLRLTAVEGRVALVQAVADGPVLHVRPGELIGDTPWRLREVRAQQAGLPAVLNPSAVIEDTRDGRLLLLSLNRVARGRQRAAVVQLQGTELEHEAREGDGFELNGEKLTVQSITRAEVVLVDVYGATKTLRR